MGDEGKNIAPMPVCFIVEVLTTAILMFIGCMGCIYPYNMGPLLPSFCWGYAILMSISSCNHIAPVHMNPAVTIALTIVGQHPLKYMPIYFLGQFVGSFLGYTLLYILAPYRDNMCLLVKDVHMSTLTAFCSEILCSMMLILGILGMTDKRNEANMDSFPLRVGCMVAGLIVCLGPLTGAGLNPARAMPPVIFYWDFYDLWVYLAGPIIGMVSGALLYRFVLDDLEEHSVHSWIVRTFGS